MSDHDGGGGVQTPLQRLCAEQAQIVARRQLNVLGIDSDIVRNRYLSERWTEATPRVISTVTGTHTLEQREWIAVLHAGPRSMLGGLSAAARHGLKGWVRDDVTVMVDDELSFEPVEGVRFYRCRRPFRLLLSPKSGIPTCRLEPTVLLTAGYHLNIRHAHGLLAATVQQRLTTASRLVEWIDLLQPLRRGKPFKRVLSQIDQGSHSGAELDLLTMCHQYGVRLPDRQAKRIDNRGVPRWIDAEWDLTDGTILELEIDGSFHFEYQHWSDDIRRARRTVERGRLKIRATAYELLHEPGEVAFDLLALGVPRSQPGAAA